MTDVSFGIKRIRITNVGTISDLELEIVDRNILALTAGNGIGKTTILEAISLVGHLPCFPTLERSSRLVAKSFLSRHLPDDEYSTVACDHRWYEQLEEFDGFYARGLEAWLDDNRPQQGHQYGLVEFELFDRRGTTAIEYHFAILVHNPRLEKAAAPRLTDLLSRGEFDQKSGDYAAFSDDRFLECCGLVLYDRAKHQMHTLIEQIAHGRSFNIEHKNGEKTLQLRLELKGDSQQPISPRSVSYVNTDLNDFGRGNDLRESPKDLERDFGAEMIQRLRLEFNDEDDYARLDKLRGTCARVLSTPTSFYSLGNVVPGRFHIDEISRSATGAVIRINRLDGSPSIDVNFLSAGENEVVFVALVTLNACFNESWGPSILLLDEPDLHIANSARARFFDEILELAKGQCQLIICTHSAAITDALRRANVKPRNAMQSVFRVAENYDPQKIKMVSTYDSIYVERMRSINFASKPLVELYRTSRGFLRRQVAETKAAIDATKLSQYHVTTLWASFLLVGLVVVSIFVLMIMGIFSLVNDDVFTTDPRSFHWHEIVEKVAPYVLSGLLFPSLIILLLRLNLRRLRAKLADKIKQTAGRS